MINLEIIISVLEVIGGLIGILAISIVIWDHFKDDRRLTREVQEYYESLEQIIVVNINKARIQNEGEKLEILNEFEYYQSFAKTRFEECSKYLGLMIGKARDNRYDFLNAYKTKSGFLLIEDGHLLFRDPNRYKSEGIFELHTVGNEKYLHKHEVNYINSFFLDLRTHWKEKYSKKFFRPKLKQNFDFNELITDRN